ncbi:antiviral RADAR system adenosine triphosphatase RdrA [Undibacterium squillarum]|uniref:antiviral RADAR system adenosine triphosphatase RdrA n=1 Tax=Undibacterium squillarum TaxID=1131567 RepID=UPI0035B0E870
MDQGQKNKYIPLDAVESAVLDDVNKLLPRDDIYEPLAKLILQASERASNFQRVSFNEQRTHNAIFIDGARGTGKTAVLLNLKRYIEFAHKELLANIHILDPIDPTLLEDGESLFLHIIVAAVLHDKEVKEAQRNKQDAYRTLNQALDKLAQSLEAIETAEKQHGIDKVRAMYSNRALAESVHEFFGAAASLLGKKLLILPIDDVDTSLNLAFENLEIIRRYLTTPYVLPIVSGDKKLYHEVTWRDFHGRLTKDSKELRVSARETALELADEYHRKVLPLPRRLTMPSVSSYWQWRRDGQNQGIVTIGKEVNALPLTNFISWLEIFLTGPVNGLEGSRLSLPIPSIRALTQLVGHCQNIIQELPSGIRTAITELEVKRTWQMPEVPLVVMKSFHEKNSEISKLAKRNYSEAYRIFAEQMRNQPEGERDANSENIKINKWVVILANYFKHEAKGGSVVLILEAMRYWNNYLKLARSRQQSPNLNNDVLLPSIFDTPLFQPLLQNEGDYVQFEKNGDLSDWVVSLKGRISDEWLSSLRNHKTILSYPVPEIGVNTKLNWDYAEEVFNIDPASFDSKEVTVFDRAIFLIDLLRQDNFYTNVKKTRLLNVGRIFELLIMSVMVPVSYNDVERILLGSPFFSTNSLVPTKNLFFDDSVKESGQANVDQNGVDDYGFSGNLVSELVSDIEKWREQYELNEIKLSPWLVYNVFNKVFNQFASNEISSSGMTDIGGAINIAGHIFYSTWAAFASFEKGELFGMQNFISRVNIDKDRLKNFKKNEVFLVNLRPFLRDAPGSLGGENFDKKRRFGIVTRSVSFSLLNHPLKKMIDECMNFDWPDRKFFEKKKPLDQNLTSREWLCQKLNMAVVPNVLKNARIINEMDKLSLDVRKEIVGDMMERFPKEGLTKRVIDIVNKINSEMP